MPLDPALKDARPTDIVIPIMGATGAGKSTMINHLLAHVGDGRKVKVGDQLASCTVDLQSLVISNQIEGRGVKFKNLTNDHRIVIVDTPGFDDTTVSDFQILKRISKWLEESLERKAILGGVIHLHDISQDRFPNTAQRNLDKFTHLCSEATLEKTVLVTTKWGPSGTNRGFKGREKELRDVYWKDILHQRNGQGGASLMRLDNTGEGGEGASAWAVVTHILEQLDSRLDGRPPEDDLQVKDGEAQMHCKPFIEGDGTKEVQPQFKETARVQQQSSAFETYGCEGDGEEEQLCPSIHKPKASKRKRFARIRSFFRRFC